MGLTFFKANKAVKGCGMSASINSREGNLFLQIFKQDSWNDQTKLGSFRGEKMNVKFSLGEVGGLMVAIEKNEEFSAYHTNKTQQTSIKFSPYKVGDVQKGFGLALFKEDKATGVKTSFLMPIAFSEAKILHEYFRFFMHRHFAAIYAADKESFKEREEKKALKPAAQKPVTQETTTTAPDISSTTQEATPSASGDDIF